MISMDCRTDSPDVLPGHISPVPVPLHTGRSIPGPIHPDDLKGLREWVYAKRLSEMKNGKNGPRMYSAPWRIG